MAARPPSAIFVFSKPRFFSQSRRKRALADLHGIVQVLPLEGGDGLRLGVLILFLPKRGVFSGEAHKKRRRAFETSGGGPRFEDAPFVNHSFFTQTTPI